MLALEEICSRYVTAVNGSLPQINAVIAGYTDREKTRFLSANGVKNLDTKEPVSKDSTMCYYSCTKSITAMATLILWDRGEVDLDTPAKVYLPILGEFGIIDEDQVDSDTGDLKYPPKTAQNDITIRHLLLHTSGFAYLITDSRYLSIFRKKRLFGPSMKIFDPLIMPLTFEPGTSWVYGHSFDWLGLIIEAVSGKKLSTFLQENIFSKADMSSCTFQMLDPSTMVHLHDKSGDDLQVYKRPLPVPFTSEVDMGGQGCYGTIGDYLKFLRIWLNFGISPDTGARILSEEAVKYAVKNHLPSEYFASFPIPFSDPSNGYSLIGCGYTGKPLSTGRPVGALYWAGLGNLYFWIDLENGCAGIWGSQIMPYMDDSCVAGFEEFEAAVYKDFRDRKSESPKL